MAKKKLPPAAPAIAEDIVEKVVLLLITLRSRVEVLEQCTTHKQLNLSPADAAAAIDEAQRRIKLAAAVDFDAELGKAQARLATIYQKSTKVHDYKTALAVQKEISKLLGLYPSKRDPETNPTGPDDSEALAEIVAARGQLAPLVGAGDDEPLADIARRVVGLFTRQSR